MSTRPLKVMFLIDSLGTGGAERHLAERLPLLEQFTISPIVVALRARQEGVQHDLQRQGFDVKVLNQTTLPGRVAAVRALLRTHRPDLLETTLFHSDLVGRLATVGTSVRVVTRLVNTDYDAARLGAPHVGRVRFHAARLLDAWTARHLTDRVYANSDAVRTAAARDLNIDPGRITVVPEARDPSRLGRPSADRRRRARECLRIPADVEVLVNVGRQDFQKGQCHLIEAMHLLTPNHPRLLLLIAGRRGEMSQELERLCTAWELTERVRFLGHREDVAEVLAAADLFVFPSLYEGLPGAVLEAMALGLPVVASDIAPVREAVEAGRSAVLVERGSAVELANAVGSLLKDSDRARALGLRGRLLFEEWVAHDDSLALAVSVYHEVASCPRPPAARWSIW
jgi:glycosyltransferase involved in cell wall biosynthesis